MSTVDDMQEWIISRFPDATVRTTHRSDYEAVTIGSVALVVTGDLETDGQDRAVTAGLDLRADVLKVAHHGSARQSPDFLTATGARMALVSVGAGNSYGHPAARTVDALGLLGMRVMRTDRNGAVAVVVLGDGALRAVSRR